MSVNHSHVIHMLHLHLYQTAGRTAAIYMSISMNLRPVPVPVPQAADVPTFRDAVADGCGNALWPWGWFNPIGGPDYWNVKQNFNTNRQTFKIIVGKQISQEKAHKNYWFVTRTLHKSKQQIWHSQQVIRLISVSLYSLESLLKQDWRKSL